MSGDERAIRDAAIAIHHVECSCPNPGGHSNETIEHRNKLARAAIEAHEAAKGEAVSVPGCAWCDSSSRGSAWHNDGLLHPSCGQVDHGHGLVPDAEAVKSEGEKRGANPSVESMAVVLRHRYDWDGEVILTDVVRDVLAMAPARDYPTAAPVVESVWSCAHCGQGSEAHWMPSSPSFKCVAEMVLVPVTPTPSESEREALASIIREYMPGADGEADSATITNAVLAAGFRRYATTSAAVSAEQVEAASEALFHAGPGTYTWSEMVSEDPSRADIWRADTRAILRAAGLNVEPQP